MTSQEEDRAHRLGVIDGRVGALEDRLGRHENYVGEQLRSISGKLDTMTEKFNEAVGGSKVAWAIAGIAGACFGGFFGPLIERILRP